MTKKLLTIFIGFLLVGTIPLAIGQQETDIIPVNEESDAESQNILGAAFIAGFILNPEKVGLKTQAKAIALVYYEPGILFKDRGVALGLKTVTFRDGNLLYMSEPNQLGLVLVAGMVTGFKVNTLG